MPEEWQQIGEHQLRVEGDIFVSRWVGACSLEEMNEFLRRLEALLPTIPQLFLLIDNTHSAPGIPEVRRRLYDWARSHHVGGGVVIYGANTPTRAIGMLLINAIALFKRDKSGKRMVIVRDEAEARAWVERRRAELQAPARSGKHRHL